MVTQLEFLDHNIEIMSLRTTINKLSLILDETLRENEILKKQLENAGSISCLQ
jgi:hypothetical protein